MIIISTDNQRVIITPMSEVDKSDYQHFQGSKDLMLKLVNYSGYTLVFDMSHRTMCCDLCLAMLMSSRKMFPQAKIVVEAQKPMIDWLKEVDLDKFFTLRIAKRK